MGRRPSKRWPMEPLMRVAGTSSMVVFAEAIGVDRREVYRWRDAGGVTSVMADRLTVRFGWTPGVVWPDWYDEDAAAAAAADADREERRRAMRRAQAQRYRARHPDRVAAQRARYREENRDVQVRYRRAYYRLNRVEVLEQQRLYKKSRRAGDVAA